MEMADISNLDREGKLRAASDRMRLSALGNRLWHSDASFRAIPAKYSLLSARVVPGKGGNTEFADMRGAYDALDDETKRQVEDLICLHSNAYSREQIGFAKADTGRRIRTSWFRFGIVWCATIRAPGERRCTCRHISVPSSVGRCPRRAPSSAI